MISSTRTSVGAHLAALNHKLDPDVINGWDDAQRLQVVTWAAAEILARAEGPANPHARPDFVPEADTTPNTGG